MKKRFFLAAIAVLLIAALAGCGASTAAKTETTAETAASFAVTQQDDSKPVAKGTVPAKGFRDRASYTVLTFSNETGVDIYELYFASSQASEWGDDFLGRNAPLENGYSITFEKGFSYAEDDTLWDLKLVDLDGNSIKFECLDLTLSGNPKEVTLVLSYNADGDNFSVTIM